MRFGEVIKYNAEEFIYLAETDKVIYLAKIPSEDLSQKAIKLSRIKLTLGGKDMDRVLDARLLQFIELSTEEFKRRIAFYGWPGEDRSEKFDLFADRTEFTLNTEDKNNLKNEIISDTGVSGELKSLIKDITIE